LKRRRNFLKVPALAPFARRVHEPGVPASVASADNGRHQRNAEPEPEPPVEAFWIRGNCSLPPVEPVRIITLDDLMRMLEMLERFCRPAIVLSRPDVDALGGFVIPDGFRAIDVLYSQSAIVGPSIKVGFTTPRTLEEVARLRGIEL
jgi:hypothetical protein